MTGERDGVGIPAVMVSATDGEALIGRLAEDEAVKLRIDKSRHVTRTDAGNVLYAQSSRGPNPVLPDILNPDVVAPGTDILGAQTSVVANGVRGESFQYLSGTSMAVPHVAGAAALLMEAHADRSPALIPSALVTTARPDVQREDGTTLADGFDVGAGYIVPSAANTPGQFSNSKHCTGITLVPPGLIPRTRSDRHASQGVDNAVPDLISSSTFNHR